MLAKTSMLSIGLQLFYDVRAQAELLTTTVSHGAQLAGVATTRATARSFTVPSRLVHNIQLYLLNNFCSVMSVQHGSWNAAIDRFICTNRIEEIISLPCYASFAQGLLPVIGHAAESSSSIWNTDRFVSFNAWSEREGIRICILPPHLLFQPRIWPSHDEFELFVVRITIVLYFSKVGIIRGCRITTVFEEVVGAPKFSSSLSGNQNDTWMWIMWLIFCYGYSSNRECFWTIRVQVDQDILSTFFPSWLEAPRHSPVVIGSELTAYRLLCYKAVVGGQFFVIAEVYVVLVGLIALCAVPYCNVEVHRIPFFGGNATTWRLVLPLRDSE
mmetsp:Transcript_37402/g.72078  ORF Transcript_37402/g.72078 Transcript_37402/m.72078 type:complete len:328 (+) Transcript_37402:97-1080(+)